MVRLAGLVVAVQEGGDEAPGEAAAGRTAGLVRNVGAGSRSGPRHLKALCSAPVAAAAGTVLVHRSIPDGVPGHCATPAELSIARANFKVVAETDTGADALLMSTSILHETGARLAPHTSTTNVAPPRLGIARADVVPVVPTQVTQCHETQQTRPGAY